MEPSHSRKDCPHASHRSAELATRPSHSVRTADPAGTRRSGGRRLRDSDARAGGRAVVGVAVGDGTYVTPTFKKTCTWTVGDSASGIRFVTLNLQRLDQFAAGKQVGGLKSVGVTRVGGIGDDAYYLGVGSTEGLIVRKGQRAFKIAVYSTLPLEKKRAMEKSLAQQVLAKL